MQCVLIIDYPDGTKFIIGGRKEDGVWQWEPKGFPAFKMIYTNWLPGAPDQPETEDCVEFIGKGWNDIPCDAPRHFLCEKKAHVYDHDNFLVGK